MVQRGQSESGAARLQRMLKDTFRSLQNRHYRLWAGGTAVSNVGTWMQRIAQDWLVLTQLTHHNATAVGVVMALLALCRLKTAAPPRAHPAATGRGRFGEGFRYLRARPDLLTMLAMLSLVATFGLNFPIFIATMTVGVFHTGVGSYGFLTTMMAIGAVAGALIAARRERPRLRQLIASAALFGLTCALAALAPGYAAFAALLVAVGIAAQVFTTSTHSLLQLEAAPAVRGRVVSIVLAVFLGTTPLGAPAVGWVADVFGPRWALGVAAASGLAAAAVGLLFCFSAGRKAFRNGRAGPIG